MSNVNICPVVTATCILDWWTTSRCNGHRARLECSRSRVWAPVRSNQTIKLLFVASPQSIQH